jgi:hypothetical protein
VRPAVLDRAGGGDQGIGSRNAANGFCRNHWEGAREGCADFIAGPCRPVAE